MIHQVAITASHLGGGEEAGHADVDQRPCLIVRMARERVDVERADRTTEDEGLREGGGNLDFACANQSVVI